MNERRQVKVGDKITAKAGAKLRRTFNDAVFRCFFGTDEKCTVREKSAGDNGQFICIDCGDLPQNNMMAQSHPKSHRIAWRNFDRDGRLEVP